MDTPGQAGGQHGQQHVRKDSWRTRCETQVRCKVTHTEDNITSVRDTVPEMQRHGISNARTVCVSGSGIMPRPAERCQRSNLVADMNLLTLRVLSQLPVQSAMPSALTPKQLTRFSCPVNTPTRSPLSVSQTLQVQSSYPPKRMRPEMEKATDVIPHRMLSCVNELSSRSARMSNSRHEASSEPVANASPLGKKLWHIISNSRDSPHGRRTLRR